MGPCAQANSDHQGAVWGFYGVWRKWDFQRDRLCTRALLHSQLHSETPMLPLHRCTLMEAAASRNTAESQHDHENVKLKWSKMISHWFSSQSKMRCKVTDFLTHLCFQLKHVALTNVLMVIIACYDSNCKWLLDYVCMIVTAVTGGFKGNRGAEF